MFRDETNTWKKVHCALKEHHFFLYCSSRETNWLLKSKLPKKLRKVLHLSSRPNEFHCMSQNWQNFSLLLTDNGEVEQSISRGCSFKVDSAAIDSGFQSVNFFNMKIGRSISPMEAGTAPKASFIVTPSLSVLRASVACIVALKEKEKEFQGISPSLLA